MPPAINGHGYRQEKPGVPIQPPAANREQPPVDLAAWARGEELRTLAEVQTAIEDHAFTKAYPEIKRLIDERVGPLRDVHDAVMFLIREGLVGADEVDVDLDDDT